jgi:amidase
MVAPDALDALGMAAAVRAGDVSPIDLVEHAIARIEALDPHETTVPLRCFDEARTAARAIRRGDARPFAGVPFLIKDHEVDVAGWPTWSCGDYDAHPTDDSMLVRRYRDAGLILLGKTTLPEMALMGHTMSRRYRETSNPWDRTRNPGGSSGGAAAAVAARMVPAAHAADGGGSIRIPASACGGFGLKPSRGRVSVAPATEAWLGLCQNHAVTRTVRDSAALLDVAAQPVPGDHWIVPPPPRPFLDATKDDPPALRIAAFHGTLYGDRLHPDCAAAVASAAQLLEDLGHRVEPIQTIGIDRDALVEAYFVGVSSSTRAFVEAVVR